MNGTAVVIDPANGRILAMVNQKLALSPGAEPCSTIKLTVALAALSEGLVTSDTKVKLPGFRMDMTQALAKSNNLYFEELGRELGFERVRHYANEFGLGELAGYNISGEQLGVYPDQPIPESEGGVARMCSFGQGVSANSVAVGRIGCGHRQRWNALLPAASHHGGRDCQRSAQGQAHPRYRRYLPDLEDGMAGAVEYGTARRLRTNFRELPIFGKTRTCSNEGTRFGWFASYSESPQGGLVTVFFLEGGRATFGPRAAELTGAFYEDLWDHDYFGERNQEAKTAPGEVPRKARRCQRQPCPAGPRRLTSNSSELQIQNAKSRLRAAFFARPAARIYPVRSMNEVKWVVAGIGDIARKRVIPAIQSEPRSRLHGFMTRISESRRLSRHAQLAKHRRSRL